MIRFAMQLSYCIMSEMGGSESHAGVQLCVCSGDAAC